MYQITACAIKDITLGEKCIVVGKFLYLLGEYEYWWYFFFKINRCANRFIQIGSVQNRRNPWNKLSPLLIFSIHFLAESRHNGQANLLRGIYKKPLQDRIFFFLCKTEV